MSGLSIKVESIEMEAMLNELAGRMGDLTPVMQTIGEIIMEQTDTAFETGVAPDGQAWPASERAMATGGQTLIDTAVLRNSITVQATENQVEVGSERPLRRNPTNLAEKAAAASKAPIPSRSVPCPTRPDTRRGPR
jgi:phage gpG-like protein